MSVYDIKIKRFALLLLPTALRKPLLAGLVQSAVQGCNVLYGEFMRWRNDRNYRLWHNGQVCYLRAVLNDTFDQTGRRITVDDDAVGVQGMRLFTRDMDRQILVPVRSTGRAIIINRRGYGGVSGYDFWVSIPYALSGRIDETRLAAVVSNYKLASKRWTVNYK
jgi:hypothetical protein